MENNITGREGGTTKHNAKACPLSAEERQPRSEGDLGIMRYKAAVEPYDREALEAVLRLSAVTSRPAERRLRHVHRQFAARRGQRAMLFGPTVAALAR